MQPTADPRIPIVMGEPPGPNDAALVEDGHPMPATGYATRFTLSPQTGHPPACACCAPRAPAATTLNTLFQARARNQTPYFTRLTILASPESQTAIRDAVTHDVVCRARFRVVDGF